MLAVTSVMDRWMLATPLPILPRMILSSTADKPGRECLRLILLLWAYQLPSQDAMAAVEVLVILLKGFQGARARSDIPR